MTVIYFFILFVCLIRVFAVSAVTLNSTCCSCGFVSASGARCAPDGGWLSAPGLLLLWTESVGANHTFPPDQVQTRLLFDLFVWVLSFI